MSNVKFVSAATVRAYVLANPDKFSDEDVTAIQSATRGRISVSVQKAFAKAHKGKKRYEAGTPSKVVTLKGPRGKVREMTFAEARALVGAEGKRGRLSADDMTALREVAFSE